MVASFHLSGLIELLRHELRPDRRQLFDEVLGGVIEANEHNVEVAVQDAEVKIEAKLLLRRELLDRLYMLQFER